MIVDTKHLFTKYAYSIKVEVDRTTIDRRIKAGKIKTIEINGKTLILDQK